MNKNKSGVFLLIPILLVFVVILTLGLFWYLMNPLDKVPLQDSEQQSDLAENSEWKEYNFPEIDLIFKAPSDLEVTFDKETLTMYVQKGNGGDSSYYQLYGIYQIGSEYIPENLEIFKDDLKDTTEIKLDGFEAMQGQVIGTRNRFATYIVTDKGIFKLFTAEPTEENRVLTENILKTFEFTNE